MVEGNWLGTKMRVLNPPSCNLWAPKESNGKKGVNHEIFVLFSLTVKGLPNSKYTAQLYDQGELVKEF